MSAELVMRRDREFERHATREICAGLGIDVDAFIELAERRADQFETEYGHDFPDLERNLERETADELLDARNYIVWRLDATRRGCCEGNVAMLQLALKHVALAFIAIRVAETTLDSLT